MRARCIVVVLYSVMLVGSGAPNNARFMGMGNFDFLFQDDYQRLDLYNFAGISSGFFRNDTLSFVALRGSVLREEWERDSVLYWGIGQALPERLQDYAPVEALEYYESIPAFDLVPWELVYVSRRTETGYDYFGGEQSRQAWGFWGGYSRLSRSVDEETESISTPAINLIYSRPVSNKLDFGLAFDGFYGSYSSPDNRYGASLIPLGGGAGISYNDAKLDLGINTEYHYLHFNFDSPSSDETFSGHAIAPAAGSVVRVSALTWASMVDYKWVSLAGSYDGNDLGEVQITSYSAKTQLLYALNVFRATFFGAFDRQKPVYTDQNDNVDFETVYENYLLSGGIGFIHGPAMIGVEGIYQSVSTEDMILEETIKGLEQGVKIGFEISPVKQIFLRGGFDYLVYDPDLDSEDDQSRTNTIAGGFGLNLSGMTRLELGYNYKQTETDRYADERITDHIVFFYLKQGMTEEGF
jgi:hypothetical protein